MKRASRLLVFFISSAISREYSRDAEGYPVGFLSDCPGSTKNSTIPEKYLKELFFLVQPGSKAKPSWSRYNYYAAVDGIASNPDLDLVTRKTMLYVSGYLDSTAFPLARTVGTAYVGRSYNAVLFDATRITSYPYPTSARLVRTVGRKVADVLVELYRRGKLDPSNLELVGISLGTHICSFAAKNFFKETGVKVSRITALDPAGPCFRHQEPENRLDREDAEFLDVVHTNIDGLGMAAPVGHIDFYVNGGEYQVSAYENLPCSMACSHVRSLFLWLAALENPDNFIGIKCDTVQQARDRECYGRMPQETALLGLNIDKGKRGLFYLATTNVEPYFMGKDGLDGKNDGYLKTMAKFDKEENMVLN